METKITQKIIEQYANFSTERWQLLKNGVPVMVCSSIEEAENEYCKHDCDEMRKISESEDNY